MTVWVPPMRSVSHPRGRLSSDDAAPRRGPEAAAWPGRFLRTTPGRWRPRGSLAEERQSLRGDRRKLVRKRPADETRNEHATVRSLQRLDCWKKPFPVWHVGWDATFPRLNRYVATVRSDMSLPAAGQCGVPCFAAKGATWQPVNPGAVFESTPRETTSEPLAST